MSQDQNPARGIMSQLPTDKLFAGLRELAQQAVKTAGKRALSSLGGGGAGGAVKDKVKDTVKETVTGTVKDKAGAVTDTVKDAVTGDGGGGGSATTGAKVTNIVEEIDVGVPISVAYNQWTRFTDFPDFMKKVEKVEQTSDEELSWRAQILWSHRDWKSTIVEQVPDERIVWRSEGAKGYVDGAVTFHELAPSLTKILVVLEYHPQGAFEKIGNLWRAQGRRVRLELKHFRRHVMTDVILHPDEVQGWRGEIHDGEVTPPEEREQSEAGADQEEQQKEGQS